jgi:hypothetical protein
MKRNLGIGRLLTGWSLVRIRLGEPPQIKGLAEFYVLHSTPRLSA